MGGGSPTGDEGPAVVKSVAVSAEDVVAAVEARRQRGERVVLRVTPPFSGRMRARLHVPRGDDASGPAAYVDPTDLLTDDAPSYPRPSETEDELRDDPGIEYTVERHRDRHADAVADWRERLPEYLAETTTLRTPEGDHSVDVAVLG